MTLAILLPTIVMVVLVLLLAVLPTFGILDVIAAHQDAVAASTPGRAGGTAIAATDILDDDGKIDEDSQGRTPTLMAVVGAEYDVLTDELVGNGWWSLQPNKWPNTRRITGYLNHVASERTESGAGTFHIDVPRQIIINQMFDIPMTKNLDWISGNTKWATSILNADVCLLWCYSYGPRYPWNPANRLHRILKVADGAMAAADVFDEAWAAQLTGVTPGLDETKDYIIRGVIFEPAVKDKLSALVRISTQKGEYKVIGFGPGNMLQSVETIFAFDGIPIHGLTGLRAEHLGGATDTPYAGVILEEIGESYVAGARGTVGATTLPAAPPGGTTLIPGGLAAATGGGSKQAAGLGTLLQAGLGMIKQGRF